MPHLTDTTTLDDLPKPPIAFTYSELLRLSVLVRLDLCSPISDEYEETLNHILEKIETARQTVIT